MVAGVQPGEAAAQGFYMEGTPAEVFVVDAGDLDLAAGGGFYVFGYFYDIVVIEVEARYGVVGLGIYGLFLDGEGFAVFVKGYDAVFSGVFYIVAEDGGALGAGGGIFQDSGKALSIEDIIS